MKQNHFLVSGGWVGELWVIERKEKSLMRDYNRWWCMRCTWTELPGSRVTTTWCGIEGCGLKPFKKCFSKFLLWYLQFYCICLLEDSFGYFSLVSCSTWFLNRVEVKYGIIKMQRFSYKKLYWKHDNNFGKPRSWWTSVLSVLTPGRSEDKKLLSLIKSLVRLPDLQLSSTASSAGALTENQLEEF